MSRLRTGLALCIVLLMTGCSTPVEEPPTRVAPSGNSPQTDALADGNITRDEYEFSFRAFVTCAEAAGYEVLQSGETGNVINYSTATAGQAEVDACYVETFQNVDATWQSQNAINSPTFDKFRECLKEAGIQPGTTVESIVAQLEDAGILQADCASN